MGRSPPSCLFISCWNISQSSEILESRAAGLSRQSRAFSRHIFLRTLSFPARTLHPRPRITRSWRASARTNKIFRVNEVRDAASPVEPLISTSHTWIQLRRTSIRESSLPGFFPFARIHLYHVRTFAYMSVCACVRESVCWIFNIRVCNSRVTYDSAAH